MSAPDQSGSWTLVLPKETVSDDTFLIVRWLAPSGTSVSVGDPIVEVETSKSAVELTSEHSGIVHHVHPAGSHLAVGRAVAVVAQTQLPPAEVALILDAALPAAHPVLNGEAPRFSAAARAALDASGLTERDFDGAGLVTEAMVARAAEVARASTSGRTRLDGSALVVVGGGGHAAIVIDLVRAARTFRIVGVVDDGLPPGDTVCGVPVLGPLSELGALHDSGVRLAVNAIAGLRDRSLRGRVWDRLKDEGFGLPTLVHPAAWIEDSATLGEGVHVLAGSYVGPRVVLRDDAIVNAHAVVSHDCVIGEHAHVAPSATLAGDVRVGRCSLVGMGSTVFLGVRVGQHAVIANGAAVTADVPDDGIVRAAAPG